MVTPEHDAHWMRVALTEARLAAAEGEAPVGAVLVQRDNSEAAGTLLARAHNRRETDCDPTAHAEILVLREAGRKREGWRLTGTTLYVTLEPCPMCIGAAMLARVDRVVYGARDPVMGTVGSLYDLARDTRFPHTLHVTGGVLAEECGQLITEFFRNQRRHGAAANSAPLAMASHSTPADRRGGKNRHIQRKGGASGVDTIGEMPELAEGARLEIV